MDADGGGTICVDEMQSALGAMGVSVSTEEVCPMNDAGLPVGCRV